MQGEIIAAKLLGGKLHTYPTLTSAKGKEKIKIEEKEVYLFDILKPNQIFNFLVKEKQIKLPKGHKLPQMDQIQNMMYYKWHNSYSHYTNNYIVFCNVI